ncbi:MULTISPECIES: glycosyltransferase family 4 protein [Lactiplantibacillus]|uniref:glycosyltransferase family 4 protein n=1 Tax=Lactiplantibacillus TaxID=2767842 RepID=UPI001C1FB9B4|nr:MULTISPECIES: glycosyltransferase family 4 protein [Lactiplantibacillus]MBU7530825.1 glycosyltransferase family 4 protein [Lactiplantibacillus pentosus]MCF1426231.1 glycosyltransferase family 4 protein [Lactiplantibacillus plantarum]
MIKGKNVLMISSVASMIKQFNLDNIRMLQDKGCTISVATNFESGDSMDKQQVTDFKQYLKEHNVLYYQVDFSRGIGTINSNLTAYKQLLHITGETRFSLIHTHSPLASVLARLVGKKKHIPVIYTAHGFQFFTGGRKKDWLLFYPIEKILSGFTDDLITINKEDFNRAKQKFYAKNVDYIPSVGIDTNKFLNAPINKELKLKINNKFTVIQVGELSKRKNQEMTIKAISLLKNKNINLLLCGIGNEEKNLRDLVGRLGLNNQVHFLGYQPHVEEIYRIADLAIMPSLREGFGLAGIEAMASGLPLLASNINGIRDYTKQGITGYYYDPLDTFGFSNGIEVLLENDELRKKMGSNNQLVAQKFDKKCVNKIMLNIYSRFI